LNGKVFESIAEAQAHLDAWVHEYNFERRHQGIGDVVPWERFRLAISAPAVPVEPIEEPSGAGLSNLASRDGAWRTLMSPW